MRHPHQRPLRLLSLLVVLGTLVDLPVAGMQTDVQRLGKRALATTSLAAKEYGEGVAGGQVVASEEVDEARLFLNEARTALAQLPSSIGLPAIPLVDSMLHTVERTGEPTILRSLADSLETLLSLNIPGLAESVPPSRPDLNIGRGIFADACSTCHGATGVGDGAGGATLDPRPSDLTDIAALSDQTPLDYYRKVLIGVSGTGMPAFEGTLTEEQIWEVAWYATTLRYREVNIDEGNALLNQVCASCTQPGNLLPRSTFIPSTLADPDEVARASDQELLARLNNLAGNQSRIDSSAITDLVGFVRTLPFAVERADIPAFAATRSEILRGLRLANTGDVSAASNKILDAYVAFESVEPDVALRNSGLATDLEFAFAELRGRVGSNGSPTSIATSYQSLDRLLHRAEATLSVRTSPIGFFVQSFFLLLREGVEAFLIVGALAALVVRAGAPESKKAIWWGVWVALGASVITAVMIETIFRIGAAQQEILEGCTMLLAAGVLLFVSYWLVSKVEVTKWKNFLSEHGNRAIRSGSLFALASAAFLAVYREGFETVLFYKALFITAGGTGVGSIAAGGLAAMVALTILYVGISRFGLRVPIRQFFAVTSAVLMYMAFSFAGKGIAELQESNLISTTIIDWAPRVPWMGIYPTRQSLLLQIGILGLIVAGLVWTFAVQPRLTPRSLGPTK